VVVVAGKCRTVPDHRPANAVLLHQAEEPRKTVKSTELIEEIIEHDDLAIVALLIGKSEPNVTALS
jgi:hypothetical protein